MSVALSLQQARANILTQSSRRELLENTNLNEMTNIKVKAFVKSVLFWYPIYTRYGQKVNEKLKLDLPNFSIFGQQQADKDMSEFRVWLTEDIKVEIKNLSRRILDDENYIANRLG